MKIDTTRLMVEIGLEKLTSDLKSKLIVAETYVSFSSKLATDRQSIDQIIFDIYTIQSKVLDLSNKCYAHNYQDLVAEINQINYICHDYSKKLRMISCK